MIIISSISIKSLIDDKIRKIILAGSAILRYNFSYFTIEENIDHIKSAQKIIGELNYNVKILADLPSDKIRLGDFDIKIFSVKEGGEYIMKSGPYSPDCNEFIPVQFGRLGEKVKLNATITLGDGEVAIRVIQIIDPETIKIQILNNGLIQAMKGFNLKGGNTECSEIKNEYEKILESLAIVEPEYIAIPYVDKKIFNNEINNKIKKLNWDKKIIIRIENQKGIDDIDSICEDDSYDMIMIDRGELGVNIPYEQIGIVQKYIIKKAKKARKKVIVSTQLMESTINSYTPLRSEILDMTNIVIDGADGIMFCKETGFGPRPSYTISVAKKIINATLDNLERRHEKNRV